MQYEFSQAVARCFVIILVASIMAVSAKPPHFPDNTQVFNNEAESVANNLVDTGLRPWQLELLAQRMAEINQLSQYNNLNGQEFGGFDRALRSGNEIKRQSRYRLCYFNPVSCFKK